MDHEFIHTQRALIEHNFEEAVKKSPTPATLKPPKFVRKIMKIKRRPLMK